MLKTGDVIEFDRKKYFKYIKPLGSGGTGDTHLFKDETTDMFFAFKKYVPKDLQYIDEYYRRFVEEIKILFKLSHQNIVRVYNYYLYPDSKVGYLQMEYIEGKPIDKFEPSNWGKDWDVIFMDLVSAFEYLEENNILHRDIRPTNILIDKDENVKLIDFGFGKQLKNEEQSGKSVFLNWPVTELPDEVQFNKIYNHQTEVYFMGKLFQYLINDRLNNFKFNHIIENMIKSNPKQRYASFNDVSKAISIGILGEIDFTEYEKAIYRKFADQLTNNIYWYLDSYNPINDVDVTLKSLHQLILDNILENHIQNNTRLIECFITGGYNYDSSPNVEVSIVKEFYELLISFNSLKRKIVLDNIYTRLSRIKIENDSDYIPF